MKILFVSENYFPNVSGVPVVVKYLAEGLYKKSYDVSIVTKSFQGEPVRDVINGVKVWRFQIYLNKFHRPKGRLNDYVDFVKNFGADIIIIECSQCITTDVLLPYLHEIPGKKIFHSHGFSGLELNFFQWRGDLLHTIGNTWNWIVSKWYFNYSLKRSMKYFDASLCLSEVDSSRIYLQRYVANSFILDNAADNIFFDHNVELGAIKKYTTLENNHYMVSCANYTVIKNQKNMILQYYKSQASKKISLICIGSYPTEYYRECCRYVDCLENKYGHRDVRLLYGIDRKDIPSIMKGASLYLVTSRYEQYSISIIEAMSQGVPFVSTNVGNARLLPGGQVIDNTNQLFTTIDQILANKELYENYSQLGRKFAYTHCRIEPTVEKLETIIQSVIKM